MPRLVWLTDIHLTFVDPPQVDAFLARVVDERPDVVAISGDIGEGPDVEPFLRKMAAVLGCPLLFVLGNHDYYRLSIARVRERMAELVREVPSLVYLSQSGPIALSPTVSIVGHDGWSDGRLGDWERSTIMLNDYVFIEELAHLRKVDRRRRLEALGDEAAAHLSRVIPQALDTAEELFVLTHVPPWHAACWYEGRLSDPNWLPHFSCQATGLAIEAALAARPERRCTVLCGHTHGRGASTIGPNLSVLTGGAVYGEPEVQRVFEVG